MYSESVGTNVQKTRVIRTDPGLHGFYRGPISDNGTSNALKSPLTTELTNLGHIQSKLRVEVQAYLIKLFIR